MSSPTALPTHPSLPSTLHHPLTPDRHHPASPTTTPHEAGSTPLLAPRPRDHFATPAGHLPTGNPAQTWEEAYERQREDKWRVKVGEDLAGWRGGVGEPRSNYTASALPSEGKTYYGQPVTGTVGTHLPKEIIRVERDWSGGEVCQFDTTYPMELEGRISPQEYTAFLHPLNTHLRRAYSVRGAVLDNLLAILTWWTSLLWRTSTFERHLSAAERWIARTNRGEADPSHPDTPKLKLEEGEGEGGGVMLIKGGWEGRGLRIRSPREVALQYLEIEYY